MNRLTKLNELKNFITENKLNLDSLLKEFNWTIEDVMKEFNKNSSNEITTKNEEEPVFPESIEWNNSCLIDNQTLQNILVEKEHDDNNSFKISHTSTTTTTTTTTTVPNKFSDLQVNFTREQKLKIYEHVINNTKKLSEPELAISMKSEDSEENKMMTFAEIVAIKRNLKRRRQKYRTTKLPPLSQTEEIRNLIDLQMQAFIQYQNEKFPSMKENKGAADGNSSSSNKIERKMKHERDDVSFDFEMKQLEAHCSSSSAVIETAIKERNYYKRKSSQNRNINNANDGSRSSSTSSIGTRSRRSRSRSKSKSKKYHRKSDKKEKDKFKKKLKKKKSKKHKNRDHNQRHHHHNHRRDEENNRSGTKKKSQQ